MSRFSIIHSDCLAALREMPDNSVDAIVTDPPYGLSFMGRKWDYDVPSVDVWAECLRVLKPGGHLLAFAGTRTQHRMAVRIEDAGFEIRDMIAWVYGCLDDATEVATEHGVMPYHKTKIGDRVLCYNPSNGEYSYQPILEIVEYEYSDTAYRLVGDFGEQVVSRNHRVIVECGGSEAFQLAETLEREARVPVLEDLPALQQAIHDAHAGAGRAQQDMRAGMCGGDNRSEELGSKAAGNPQGADGGLRGVREAGMETGCVAAQGGDANVQPQMQWGAARSGMGDTCAQGAVGMVGGIGSSPRGAHDWAEQSVVEGRSNVSQPEGSLRRSADQVRAMPCWSNEHGPRGRLCHGASSCGGTGGWETTDANGVRASHQSRCDGQSAGEPDAVRHERTAQGIRAWGGHRSAVVRVVPFHYTGKVWCLRVPTGAFVAVRNGVAFPTGNSGFPKSHNGEWGGTALKPALEPITMARKPLAGTVEANWREHGTGALNIDGCRVETDETITATRNIALGSSASGVYGTATVPGVYEQKPGGRWPANLLHDGSPEVVALFPGEGDKSAARFMYCAKASKLDREDGLERLPAVHRPNGNKWTDQDYRGSRGERPASAESGPRKNVHPTVKPADLMRYLCRLVTPPGGVVLDPFMGSGSTGKAAMLEGFRFIGIEREAEYVEIARARIEGAKSPGGGQPDLFEAAA